MSSSVRLVGIVSPLGLAPDPLRDRRRLPTRRTTCPYSSLGPSRHRASSPPARARARPFPPLAHFRRRNAAAPLPARAAPPTPRPAPSPVRHAPIAARVVLARVRPWPCELVWAFERVGERAGEQSCVARESNMGTRVNQRGEDESCAEPGVEETAQERERRQRRRAARDARRRQQSTHQEGRGQEG